MSYTLQFETNENVRLTDETVERRPPDRLEFTVTGRLTVAHPLLAAFEGATLNPVRVTVSTTDSDDVEVDLTGPASLRLEAVDVGVATPDANDIAPTNGPFAAATDDEDTTALSPDVLAFTIEGALRDVPSETFDALADDALELESLTFALDETRSDGGSEPDVLIELALFGYGIAVRRDGVIVVGRR